MTSVGFGTTSGECCGSLAKKAEHDTSTEPLVTWLFQGLKIVRRAESQVRLEAVGLTLLLSNTLLLSVRFCG